MVLPMEAGAITPGESLLRHWSLNTVTTMGTPRRARLALVLQSVVQYARYGSELARVAVGIVR